MSPSLGTFFLFDHLKIHGYIQEIIHTIFITWHLLSTESKSKASSHQHRGGTRKEKQNRRIPPKYSPDWAFLGEFP